MRYCKILLGNLLITAAYAFITVPHEILNGGTTSFAMIIAKITGWNISWIICGILLVLLTVCLLFLGKDYTVGTIFSAITYFLLFALLESFAWILPLPDIFCIPIAAAMVGVGYAICILAKSTALGFDIIALMIHQRNGKISISQTMFWINLMVLLAGLLLYGIWSVLFGIIFAFLQARVMNGILSRNTC